MAEPLRARRLTDYEGQRLLAIVRRWKHDSARVRRALIIMVSAVLAAQGRELARIRSRKGIRFGGCPLTTAA